MKHPDIDIEQLASSNRDNPGRDDMIEGQTREINPEVAAVFESYPDSVRQKLLFLRKIILDTAADLETVGELEETLKWGEPSYLTTKPRLGSTIRIAWKQSTREQYSMLFKCTANLVPEFRDRFPHAFSFGGNRSMDFHLEDDIPVKELKQCIALALTYHRNKQLPASDRWKMASRVSPIGG